MAASDDAWDLQRALVEFLEQAWRQPDHSLWEVRGPRRHFVHSKVMAWVGFDRMVQAAEHDGLPGPVQRWREQRAAVVLPGAGADDEAEGAGAEEEGPAAAGAGSPPVGADGGEELQDTTSSANPAAPSRRSRRSVLITSPRLRVEPAPVRQLLRRVRQRGPSSCS